jgi:hypothetical protein
MRQSDPVVSAGRAPGTSPDEVAALLAAIGQVLEPLARLAVARGVPIQALEEALRRSMVVAARRALGSGGGERVTSRLSAMTGLTRREVTRLEGIDAQAPPSSRTLVTEVFTLWRFDPALRTPEGQPRVLPRTGPAPSFEALAARVSRDVHPRTLLEEMQRLGLVARLAEHDEVALVEDTVVPRGRWTEMMGFLGDHVGDHFRAAADNVLGDGRAHFEQALLADELSERSIAAARALISAQWQRLMDELVPALTALMDDDRQAGRTQDQAVRIGFYSYARPMNPAGAAGQGADEEPRPEPKQDQA